MQKLHNEDKNRTTVKNIIKNFICLNCSLLTVLANILKFINNLKFIINFADFFNHICKNINIIYQLIFQFLLPCYKEKNWVSSDNSVNIEMMISICHEADDIFLWPFKAKIDMTVFFNKNAITEKNEDLKKKNEEVNFEVLNE